jgi:hypothetical protein
MIVYWCYFVSSAMVISVHFSDRRLHIATTENPALALVGLAWAVAGFVISTY